MLYIKSNSHQTRAITLSTMTLLLLLLPAFVAAAFDYAGCYSSVRPLTFEARYVFQSTGWCKARCRQRQMTVAGLSNGTSCFCGSELPSFTDRVEEIYCDLRCPGYAFDICKVPASLCNGGILTARAQLTGLVDRRGQILYFRLCRLHE